MRYTINYVHVHVHNSVLNHSLDAAHLLDSLFHGRGPEISSDLIQFMIVKSLPIRILGRLCGSQVVMENMWWDLTILWNDEDNLVG